MNTQKKYVISLDFIRALAIIHVFMYHYYIEWFGGSFLIEYGSITGNLERIKLFQDSGIFGILKNAFSFLFYYGFASVNVFLIISGFVLSYSFYSSGEFLKLKKIADWLKYYFNRFKRLLIPFYVSLILGIGILYLRNYLFPALSYPPVYEIIDFIKVFFVPFVFFKTKLLQLFNGDYWFIPLILQMYLLFPLLYAVLKRLKPAGFLLAAFIITIAYRGYAAYYLDTVPMGVIYPSENSYYYFSFFVPRLFEFAFGMAIGYLYLTKTDILAKSTGVKAFLFGILMFLGGILLNIYRFGWIFSDIFLGAGLTLIFLNLGEILAKIKIFEKAFQKISQSSYETFLMHHYFLNYILLAFLFTVGLKGNEKAFWIAMPFYFVTVLILGSGTKFLNSKIEKLLK